ncbi:hypothetical protein MRB53_011049 [Persea americana]|uniref:Uncharacterized protein n=1 Tax=Persea americana TaxID=3435 RepID=A0ACC2LUG8_PERAE|nr:hypothetical protein MRB53_011049 [Persea americana]
MKGCANRVLAGNWDSTVLQQIATGILRIEKREDGEGDTWQRRRISRRLLNAASYEKINASTDERATASADEKSLMRYSTSAEELNEKSLMRDSTSAKGDKEESLTEPGPRHLGSAAETGYY